MRKRSQRLWLIGAAAVLVAGALGLASIALKDTVAFFYTPSDLIEKHAIKEGKSARIGGLVEVGSETHNAKGELVFKLTDGANSVPVVFDNIPPDLFKEGKGAIAEGKFDGNGTLVASRVLAKHDENYMPKEVHDALCKRSPVSCAGDANTGGKEPVS